MVYKSYKIPYPNPYKEDGSTLMSKDIITNTITKALFIALLSGGLEARYGNYFDSVKYVKNLQNFDIQTEVLNDNGIAISMPQIKQMSWLPYYIDNYSHSKKTFYEPYTKYSTIEYITEPLIEAPDNAVTISGVAYYYEKAGYFLFDEKNIYLYTIEDNNLKTIYNYSDGNNNKDYKIKVICTAKNLIAFSVDNQYYIYSLKNDKVIEVDKDYYIYSLGWLGIMIVDKDVYDENLNKITTLDELLLSNADFLLSGYNENGSGIFVDGIYYLRRDDKTSYACKIRRDKETKAIKKFKCKIVKSKIGLFSSYLKYGFGFSNTNYLTDYPFKIYFYNYIKNNEFYVDKMPFKYKEMKKTKNKYVFLSAYGDLLYDLDNGYIYHTLDFRHWFRRQDMEEHYSRLWDGKRIWFSRDYKYASFYGELVKIRYNDKNYLALDGFAFK